MGYTILMIGGPGQPGKINLIGLYFVIMGYTLLMIGRPGQGKSTLLARILW